MEKYPVVTPMGEVEGFLESSADLTLYSSDRRGTVYVWLNPQLAVNATSHVVSNAIRCSSAVIELPKWLEMLSPVLAYTTSSAEAYAEQLASQLRSIIEGKRVLLAYSGGKDSTAALIILLELMKYVSFKLHVVYVHMPFLEPESNVRFVERVSRKLGVEVEIREPLRRVVARKLLEEGLPYRRARWCTYLKVRPLREAKRRLGIDFEVVGDRMYEARKRMMRLIKPAMKGELVSGKKLRLTYTLTLLDVVKIVRSKGLVHPDYLDGLPRVACTYCPYKALHELSVKREVEDPGLVEEALKRAYHKWYEGKVGFEEYMEQALWRYTPVVAKAFAEVKKTLSRIEPSLSSEKVHRDYASVWVNPLPRAPTITPREAAEMLLGAQKPQVLTAHRP